MSSISTSEAQPIDSVQSFEQVQEDALSNFNIKEEGSGFLYDRFSLYDPKTKAMHGTIEANRYFTGFNFLNPFNWAKSYTFRDSFGDVQMKLVKNYGISDLKLDAFIAAVWGLFSSSAAKSTDFNIYDGLGHKVGLIDGHLVDLRVMFDIQSAAGTILANLKIAPNKAVATFNRGSGTFGTVKVDDETLEKGDVAIHIRRGVIDDRIAALISTFLIHNNLIDGLAPSTKA